MAELLAQRHGVDTAKARLAGMLHDLARLYPAERLLTECALRSIPVDEYARAHPVVLHAPLSARLARERYGVRDEEVLCAIAKHTLGSAQMSRLDLVLYLADSLEPGREFSERAELAALAARDLDGALRATVRSSLRYLQKNRLPIAPQTAGMMQTFGVEATAMEVRTAGDS